MSSSAASRTRRRSSANRSTNFWRRWQRRSASCSWCRSLALGWRAGLVVALTIPMVLAATFFVMSLMGIDLHRISLGALIIALGLLVDDAMIAVEMMDRKLEEGHDKLSAATFAYTSTAFPMLTGTLITVAGFIPVGFAQSQAGEYVSTLFWVTGIALDDLLVRGCLFHAVDRLSAA